MHIVVTRPEGDAEALSEQLRARGHTVTIAPMLTFTAREPEIDTTDIQAVLVTSRNAVRALADRGQNLGLTRLPLFAVGPATAGAARAAGWQDVTEGAGGARDLIAVIASRLSPAGGGILHLAGDVLAIDATAELTRLGFVCRKVIVYAMEPPTILPQALDNALHKRLVDGVMLMSPRSASVYCRLVAEADLVDRARAPDYLCLSPAVAAALSPLAPCRTHVAVRPNSQEMLALVDQLSSTSSR